MPTVHIKSDYPFLQCHGEMSKRMQQFDWSATAVGHPGSWTVSLKTTVGNLLRSRFPMLLWWGDHLTQFYNDAYRLLPGNGGKHPDALGQNGADCWKEKWHAIAPLLAEVRRTGEPTPLATYPVPIAHHETPPGVCCTCSYSLVLADDGGYGGVLATFVEPAEKARYRQEGEARFRNAIEQAPVAMALIRDKDFVFESINPPMLHIIGRKSKDEVVGKKLADVLPKLTAQPMQHILEDVLETGATFSAAGLPTDLVTGGRLQTRYFDITYARIVDVDGSSSVLHMAVDVTDQVLARKKLEQNQAKLRAIVGQTPAPTLVLGGDDFLIEYVNTPMLQMMGRGAEVIGQPFLSILPQLDGHHTWQQAQRVYKEGVPFDQNEVPVPHRHGSITASNYYNVSYRPLTEDGRITGIIQVAVDVTEQVMARRRLAESEAKLRSILNSAPTAVGLFVGPDLVMENPNQLMIEVLGAGPGISGKSFRLLLDGVVSDHQKFLALLDHVRATGEPFEAREVEVFFVGENSKRYFNINFVPLFDESHAVYAVLDVSVDVTKQVTTRKKIEQSESKFRLLMEEAPFATALYIAPDLVIDTINDSMLRLWDKPATVVGKTFEAALPELDGQPFADLLKNVYHTGVEYVAKGQSADILVNGRMRRGWYNFTYKPIRNEQGRVYAILHMAVEVTDQVLAAQQVAESEANLRNMVLAAPVGVCVIDAATLVSEVVNDSFIDIAGKPRSAIVGQAHWSTFAELKPYYEATLRNVVETGVAYRASEVKLTMIRHGSEEVVYVTFAFIPLKDLEGKVSKVVLYLLENTPQVVARQQVEDLVTARTEELSKAYATLQHTNKELERSNQSLEEFAYAASHDLKEPVRKIHFFTQQLKQNLVDRLTDGEAHTFGRIENATLRMGMLIDDLLLYSHISQRPAETEAIDLNEKVQRVLEDLELDIQDKKAVITVGRLFTVQGHRRQLQQLFQNLLTNALKYSKADEPPRISITATQAEENGRRYHVIAVQDNGIGFEQEYSDKIFHMFARLHGKNQYSGTGVGLSIVKKVVENHSGFIRVKSEINKGSTFSIYLPVG